MDQIFQHLNEPEHFAVLLNTILFTLEFHLASFKIVFEDRHAELLANLIKDFRPAWMDRTIS